MTLDPAILGRLSVSVDVTNYVRIIARVHAATPLGMGPSRSRFSSPRNRFHVLYLAQDPTTAFAETVVRDRYEKKAERLLLEEELDRYSIAAVRNPHPLLLLDLRKSARRVHRCRARQSAGCWQEAKPISLRANRIRRDRLHVEDHQQGVRSSLRSRCGTVARGGQPGHRPAAIGKPPNDP